MTLVEFQTQLVSLESSLERFAYSLTGLAPNKSDFSTEG